MTEEEHFCSAAVGEEELADGLEQIAAMGRHALASPHEEAVREEAVGEEEVARAAQAVEESVFIVAAALAEGWATEG